MLAEGSVYNKCLIYLVELTSFLCIRSDYTRKSQPMEASVTYVTVFLRCWENAQIIWKGWSLFFLEETIIQRCPCRYQGSWGKHGAHLGPVGPRWAPYCPHEPCYQGAPGHFGISYLTLIVVNFFSIKRGLNSFFDTFSCYRVINRLWLIHDTNDMNPYVYVTAIT